MFLSKNNSQFHLFIFPGRSDVFVEMNGPSHPKKSESRTRSSEHLGGGEKSGTTAETKVAKGVAEPREGAEDNSGKLSEDQLSHEGGDQANGALKNLKPCHVYTNTQKKK